MLATKKYPTALPVKNFIQNGNTLEKFIKPQPIDHEIEIEPNSLLMSKTDLHGTIEYSNDYFIEVNGYQESELMGRTQNIIRHPDMPQIIFQMLWEHLQNHQNFSALIKNLAKDGRYYWVLAHFKIHNNQNNYEVGNYYAYRYAAPKTGVVEIEKLYKKLLEIEKQRGVEASKKYFVGFLEERAQSYEAYLNELTGHNRPIKRITKAIRNLFK